MKRFRAGRRFSAAAILVAAASLSFASAPAFATGPSHGYTASFGAATSTPANPYPLSGPSDIAIDQSTHDFYVTDPGNHRVEKFDSSGNFILMFGKAVDQTTGGNLCTAASGDTCQAGTSTALAGGFQSPYYLAVDNSNSSSKGDVYVSDTGTSLVSKFDSSGQLVTGWGPGGTKDGSDAFTYPLPVFGTTMTGLDVTTSGNLFVVSSHGAGNLDNSQTVWEYKPDGTFVPHGADGTAGTCGRPWLKLDPARDYYFTTGHQCDEPDFPTITVKYPPVVGSASTATQYQMTSDYPTLGFTFDPLNNELYQVVGTRTQGASTVHGPQVDHYSPDCAPKVAVCDPVDSFGDAQLSGAGPMGVAVDGTTHTVYVADNTSNDVSVFGDLRPIALTEPATNLTQTSGTMNAHIDAAGRGDVTACHFEWDFDKSYANTAPCSPDPAVSSFTGQQDVSAGLTGLSPGTTVHYRVVATNAAGLTTIGIDQTLVTTQPPSLNGAFASNLSATSADLNAHINPNGLDTTYHFEYGTTTSYGQSAPVPEGSLSASNSNQTIGVHLDNLVPGVVYHYRLFATNADGTSSTGDQTFNFYPPPCPNSNVRQQTQANFLPECRAYELVTPGDANGTSIYPDGPNTGYATSPSRLSFVGAFGILPDSGGSPIDSLGDLYVATRTDTGWVTRYIGLPASQATFDGGPPQGPPNSRPSTAFGGASALYNAGALIRQQNGVLTDLQMGTFLDWDWGSTSGVRVDSSSSPYVWGADGKAVDRWPTNLASVPSGTYDNSWPSPQADVLDTGGASVSRAPGGLHALDCPLVLTHEFFSAQYNFCPGDVTASADLSHFVFATAWNLFAPDGQLTPPGSVYDNDTKADSVSVASKLAGGAPIPEEPGDASGDALQIPAVSKDGSHILMAAGGTGPCGTALCTLGAVGTPPLGNIGGNAYCGQDFNSDHRRCPMQPSHLYMRVDGAVTYDVSKGNDVSYVGMSGDGTKVYFTSPQQLTPNDTDTSVDLYMWSQASDSITLVSIGNNGNGNSDACSGGLVTNLGVSSSQCDVTTYTQLFYCTVLTRAGGNCLSDNFIASGSGDIYFSSPEQLDGTHGLHNQQNLYVYRNGQVQYVTTLTGPPYCYNDSALGDQCLRIQRMQVSADGNHMAFVTTDQVAQSQYDNAGHAEMYTYDATNGRVTCVSCIPSGDPPSSDVVASQDGLFMTNDGRAFFSTADPLVKADTNAGEDVYEYVDGRAQLITPGTGDTSNAANNGVPGLEVTSNVVGLDGVSADGRDAYFGTFQTLVPGDHNGNFYKIYDARSGGGFTSAPPPPPCNAADECHGAGSLPPSAVQNGTGAALGSGGNVSQSSSRHRAKHHHRKRHHARHTHSQGRAAR